MNPCSYFSRHLHWQQKIDYLDECVGDLNKTRLTLVFDDLFFSLINSLNILVMTVSNSFEQPWN